MSLALPLSSNQVYKDGIETTRFRLLPIAACDETLYLDIYCNKDTMRYVGPPLSIAEATRSFRAALRQTADPQGKTKFLAVVHKTTAIAIGICGVSFGVPRLDAAEIGIMLKGDVRGQGLSHEVLAGFIDYVFVSSEARQVGVRYAVEQTAVVCLNQGLGFVVVENSAEDRDPRHSAYIDRYVWQMFVRSTNRE